MVNYNPNGIKNLCNAIVISAVKDARSGVITKEEFGAFIFSWWAYLLLRDAIDPDVIYKDVYQSDDEAFIPDKETGEKVHSLSDWAYKSN